MVNARKLSIWHLIFFGEYKSIVGKVAILLYI